MRMTAHGVPNIANTSYKGNRVYHYYLDGLRVNGKRKRLFFTTEAKAKEELKKWDRRIRKEGEDAMAISQELRILTAKMRKEARAVRKVDLGCY
jgi:hypothetical protein